MERDHFILGICASYLVHVLDAQRMINFRIRVSVRSNLRPRTKQMRSKKIVFAACNTLSSSGQTATTRNKFGLTNVIEKRKTSADVHMQDQYKIV